MLPHRGMASTSFEGTDYFFGAMVFETLGAINTEGEEILKQLFRFAALVGREFTSYCGCLSQSLVQSATLSIASDLDGQEFRDVA